MSQLDSREGWYPDPDGTPGERWWTGLEWTDAVREPKATPVARETTPKKRREPTYHRRSQSNPSVVRLPGVTRAERPVGQASRRFDRLHAAMPHADRAVAIANPQAYWSVQVGIYSLVFVSFLIVPSVIAVVLAVRGLARAEALSVAGESPTGHGRAGLGLAAGLLGLFIGAFVLLAVLSAVL